ncbi:MAG: putative lipid II flippase FtsW, partial [Mycobacterium sp.]
MNRLLRLPPPEPYAPTRAEALRDRLRSRPQQTRSQPVRRQRPRPADRAKRHSGHHGGGRRHAGQRPTRGRTRALEGQRYG